MTKYYSEYGNYMWDVECLLNDDMLVDFGENHHWRVPPPPSSMKYTSFLKEYKDQQNLQLCGVIVLGFAQNRGEIIDYVRSELRGRSAEFYDFAKEFMLDMWFKRNASRFIFTTEGGGPGGRIYNASGDSKLTVNHPDFLRELDIISDGKLYHIAIPVNDPSLIKHKAWDYINGGRTWHYPATLLREPIA